MTLPLFFFYLFSAILVASSSFQAGTVSILADDLPGVVDAQTEAEGRAERAQVQDDVQSGHIVRGRL